MFWLLLFSPMLFLPCILTKIYKEQIYTNAANNDGDFFEEVGKIILILGKQMHKHRIYLLPLIFSLVLMLGAFLFERSGTSSLNQICKSAEEKINIRAAECKKALEILNTNKIDSVNETLINFFLTKKIALYSFQGDSLVYWNNAQIPMPQTPKSFTKNFGIIKLRQGFYLYFKSKIGGQTRIALCLVKPLYDLQNNYLQNDFAKWTGIPKEIDMAKDSLSGNAVFLEHEKLFALKGDEAFYYSSRADNLATAVFIGGFLLLLLAALLFIKQTNNISAQVSIASTIPLLKFLMVLFKFPGFLYRSVLYDVRVFGNARSFVNAYLGDILLNAFIILFLAAVFYSVIKPNGKKFLVLKITLVSTFIFLIVFQFNHNLVSLVNNSTLNFDLLGIFNVNYSTFVALTAIGLYCPSLLISVYLLVVLLSGQKLKFAVFFFIHLAICLLIHFTTASENLFENYWLMIFSTLLFLLLRSDQFKISWAIGLQIIIMSLVASIFLNTYIEKNQKQELDILSIKLGERQDAILESEFAEIPRRIKEDKSLNVLLNFLSEVPTSEKEIEQILIQKFFGGYFNRYNVSFSLFDEKCRPLLSPKNPVLLDEGFFDEQIKYWSDSTSVKDLFFVKNYKQNSRYIGKINLEDKNLYVLLEPKQFEELGSFPDLLLDQSQQRQEKLKNFSYAVYRANQNTNRYGDFNYPFFLQDSVTLAASNPAFVHYYFHPDENTEIVVSREAKGRNYFFTFNSYVLLFFSLINYFCYLIYAIIFTAQFQNQSLTRRIQTIIIVLLLLAMSAVGITSAKLVSSRFEADNQKELIEKTEIIINELSAQLKPEDFFDEAQKNLMNLKLKEYARLFNSDISLFNKQGYLYNTSEPKLYDLGLAAPFANPEALWKLTRNRSSSEIVNEKAGTLKYVSLYTPLFNSKKELIGFINLPYFARQSDLANQLSGFISALINVYVILFVISILAGLILSGFITQPLRLIKQQIANITLGKQNEKIEWQSNDEIGKLVSEYNQMLVKLEYSVNLLAQSERESAWREMAKQVAHEIKNPLTPMKLNLQYLQHLMKHNPEDFKEKFEKASAGIIEQIDSLAAIATEFSNFAKFPNTQLEKINLVEIIKTSALTFENQKNSLIKNKIYENEILVKGDKDQCLRVFNNVLKNALQAIEEVSNPLIEINCELSEEKVIVSISDNGCGIDEELKQKIFTPNFTTKSKGSGLGLAMVKNIVKGFEGEIWFESEKNKGTTFYIEFKKN